MNDHKNQTVRTFLDSVYIKVLKRVPEKSQQNISQKANEPNFSA